MFRMLMVFRTNFKIFPSRLAIFRNSASWSTVTTIKRDLSNDDCNCKLPLPGFGRVIVALRHQNTSYVHSCVQQKSNNKGLFSNSLGLDLDSEAHKATGNSCMWPNKQDETSRPKLNFAGLRICQQICGQLRSSRISEGLYNIARSEKTQCG